MPRRKLVDATRSKAIVGDAWETERKRTACKPNWSYMGVVQIVDTMLASKPDLDGRDIADAIVLCTEIGDPMNKGNITKCMGRIEKGRQGVHTYK